MENKLQNKDYLNTFIQLKERIIQAQYKSYSAVNSEMILAYLDIGKTISEKTKKIRKKKCGSLIKEPSE